MHAEMTTLFGLNVYTDRGVYVGKINDIVIDHNERKITGIAVIKFNTQLFDLPHKGVILPYRWIVAIGDVVLLKQLKWMTTKLEAFDKVAEPENIAS